MIRLSFRNPHLIVVTAIIVVVISAVSISKLPVDILPQFKKSTMQVLTLYPGMPAKVVEKDITSRMERWTGQSEGIERQTSKSMLGVSVVRNHFREDIDAATAMSNTSSFAMSDMFYLPPGTLPPMVMPYDPTASIPLALLAVSSETRSGKELYDLSYFDLRNMLGGIPGIIAPAAYGGTSRRIHIYVEPDKLEAYGLSQTDIMAAIQRNTTLIPSGIARIGNLEYGVNAKGMIQEVKDFNDIIIKYEKGAPVYVKDIGWAEDAGVIQTNIARVDGKRQVYLPIFKRPGANTIASVNAIREAIPLLKERLPKDVGLNVVFDQSSYVRNSINGLRNAGLEGLLMVTVVLILFLGSFRSAFIAALTLPLTVLFTFIGLYYLGYSINSMTLGGLALVLGLIVDNAIVVLENTDRHLEMGKKPTQAAMDAAIEVAMPVLVTTLVIATVFFPIAFLTGIAKYLFSSLAVTVAIAMFGSYLFSLTLIPIAAANFLREKLPKSEGKEPKSTLLGFFGQLVIKTRNGYIRTLKGALRLRWQVLAGTLLLFAFSLYMAKNIGYELFPAMDVGQITITARLEPGTPLEETEKQVMEMEQMLRDELGDELNMIVSNIGVFYDLPAAYTPNSGTQDAFFNVQLIEDHTTPATELVKRLRLRFRESFPGVEFSYNTGGIVTAALNEGLPSPIDIQILGFDIYVANAIATRIRDTIRYIEGTRDTRILQRVNPPQLDINLDREKAAVMGLSSVDAIKNLVSGLNSSATFEKAFWIDESNGNHYFVGVTYPEYQIDNEHSIDNITVTSPLHSRPIPLRNFAEIKRSSAATEINHLNLTPVTNIYVNVEDKDIGSVAAAIENRIAAMRNSFPEGYKVEVRGEIQSMNESFANLGLGLILAVILVYLIIVPLFKSFRQPLIILLAVPFGLIGVIWMLLLTDTYFSIQALMGIIMMVGITVAISNLLVDRINVLSRDTSDIGEAIISGAHDRFRPVVMTMLAAALGLTPMALGLQIGGEANVPLARAIIGGTMAALLVTLYIIPILYSFIAKKIES
ncbi:MAG: efflux RND transporter permease subunit [Bacteroidetes bacterium]|nr:efflux RND transporter permease subunit [Bacteroidota bacterium]